MVCQPTTWRLSCLVSIIRPQILPLTESAMILKATELGLGTLWIANTCFAYEDMMRFIDSPGQLIGAVAVGYADESPNPRPRKDMKEVLEYR